jgi:hypothetical protein
MPDTVEMANSSEGSDPTEELKKMNPGAKTTGDLTEANLGGDKAPATREVREKN